MINDEIENAHVMERDEGKVRSHKRRRTLSLLVVFLVNVVHQFVNFDGLLSHFFLVIGATRLAERIDH